MGKNVQRALRKAALGGSIGPVPKSHKITGEFRDPSERPHGQPWLRPWYMSPRKAEEAAGTRREDTRPPIVPRVHSIARAMSATNEVRSRRDGGPVAGDELGSDPIELERLRLAARGTAGGQPLDEATLARNAQITRDALLDVTPVIGNYRSGRRAIEAGRKLGAAEDVPSRRRAMGEVLLEGIGALSPLPWGRTAGRAAAGGKDTANVLIPALDGPATNLAREMRDAGQPMDRIWRETQRTPGPEGAMRREIRDTEMTVNPALRVGDEWALSDAIRHPALFAVRPDLATRTLKVIDATDRAGRPVVRTDMAGNFELNPAAGDLRAQLAKLLQYEIQKEGGLAQPLRHGVTAFERGIDRARTQADNLDVDASGRAVIDAYLDDLAAVDANYQLRKALDMHGSKTGMSNAAAEMGAYNAGNMEARAVAGRALGKPGDLKQWPYQRVAPYLGRAKLPAFGQTYSLPPDDLTDSQMLEFIQRWGQFGSGRSKFARGGRVKRKALAKAAKLTLGGVRGATGGRADKLPVDVPAGAYVIPADVVAALGDGNTEAGMARLDRQFPTARGYAAGGRAEPVPIQISDGEFVVSPAAVAALGGGDEGYGHEVLDEFVTQTRAAYVDHLHNLPGPQR